VLGESIEPWLRQRHREASGRRLYSKLDVLRSAARAKSQEANKGEATGTAHSAFLICFEWCGQSTAPTQPKPPARKRSAKRQWRATLKGIQFNSFGAFFSRAYRENDYLWGRLHGADRLIDITVSALPEGMYLPPGMVVGLKREIFRAILAEEKPRLTMVQPLFEELEREVG
jgi:hypothetical protein